MSSRPEVPWLRKRFVEAYEEACEQANAERAATLALKDADARVRTITSDLAAKLAMPDAKQLLGGTARAS